MNNQSTNAHAAETIALSALGWVLSDSDRAGRLLALTGLTPDQLRARIGERPLLASTLVFLEAHEPDLIACAQSLDLSPQQLVDARKRLER